MDASNHEMVIAGACLGSFKLPADLSFIVAGGQGGQLWDKAGKRYLDYLLGSGPMVLGHAHPHVVQAITKQASLGTQFYQLNDRAIALAEKIVQLVPCAESVKFCSDGSQATFYALRLARAFTGRNGILKFDGAFHGHHDYAKQTVGPHGMPTSQPEVGGIPPCISDDVLIAPFNDLQTARSVLQQHGDGIAAILVEPVQRSFVPQPDFLQGLRELADQYGALLIFDEVVTGFRVAMGGAQELYGVRPDICALGKILGGGLPLAAVAGRASVLELTDPTRPNADNRYIYMSGTLNGNPLACAAGLATLEVLEKNDGPTVLVEKGNFIADGLTSIGREFSVPLQIIGPPSVQQIVFSERTAINASQLKATNRAAARAFGLEMIRNGVLLNPDSKIYSSLAHDDECQSRFLDAATRAMRSVRDQFY